MGRSRWGKGGGRSPNKGASIVGVLSNTISGGNGHGVIKGILQMLLLVVTAPYYYYTGFVSVLY